MPRPLSYRQPRRPHAAYLRRQADGAIWMADAVLSVAFSPNWTTTDHPVEKGVDVSDHVQPQPQTIAIECVLTENPAKIGGAIGGKVSVNEKLDWLIDTANSSEPFVDVVTDRRGVFTSYLIQSLPHTIDNVSAYTFTLSLKEVRVSEAMAVEISVASIDPADATTASGAPDEVDTGEQATTSTETNPDAEETDQSVLASLLDSL